MYRNIYCLFIKNDYSLTNIYLSILFVQGHIWSNSLSPIFFLFVAPVSCFHVRPSVTPWASATSCYDWSFWLYLWRNSFVTRSGSSWACCSLIISDTLLKKVNMAKWLTVRQEVISVYWFNIYLYIYILHSGMWFPTRFWHISMKSNHFFFNFFNSDIVVLFWDCNLTAGKNATV